MSAHCLSSRQTQSQDLFAKGLGKTENILVLG